jgi:hypothetical protein
MSGSALGEPKLLAANPRKRQELPSEGKGRAFESRRVRQFFSMAYKKPPCLFSVFNSVSLPYILCVTHSSGVSPPGVALIDSALDEIR